MQYGLVTIGNTVIISFNTFVQNSGPITLAGTPAVACYKGSLTTPITTGVTLYVDRNGTGNHVVSIDTSTYDDDADYTVVLTAGTVSSVSVVGTVIGQFSTKHPAVTLNAAAVDLILDEIVEGTHTMRQLLRGFAAALLGKASGLAGTTAIFRNIDDTKARITATVDSNGNRTAITIDLT